jgi:IS4 transposase
MAATPRSDDGKTLFHKGGRISLDAGGYPDDWVMQWNVDMYYDDLPDPAEVVAAVKFAPGEYPHGDYGFSDERADWHRNTKPMHVWMRAHVYRLLRDWGDQRLADWFNENTVHAREFGFTGNDDGLGRFTAEAPSQSRLWEVWNEEFSESDRKVCQEVAEQLFLELFMHDVPVPVGPFEPEEREISSDSGEQKLIADKTKEVWKQAKPYVTDTFFLERASNASVHENAFWEQHAYMGMREDMFAQSGQHSFYIDSTRDRTPSASNHRHQLQKHSIENVRSMLREATGELIARARHNSELVGKLTVAIDITKGAPWTGESERDDDGNLTEPWILGYKGGEKHFQWATIQVVGHDIPLVLDAVPVHRGFSRADIVDELLGNALDLVGGIDLVMMDREFDSDDIKDVCDAHGVHYLNPARKHSSEKATCRRMRDSGKRVHVETQETVVGEKNRQRMFLPATNYDLFATDDAGDDSDEEEFRQELVGEFAEIMEADETGGSPFDDLVDDLREDEEIPDESEAAQAFALFETNHPSFQRDNADTPEEMLDSVQTIVRRYRHRWGIENGYKKLKKFRVRTTSKDHSYRFFNFAFACVLYNVWRLVDLLVKLAVDGENAEYAPRVDANQFLTVAKKFYGLDPPD